MQSLPQDKFNTETKIDQSPGLVGNTGLEQKKRRRLIKAVSQSPN